ncbi:hypothetical protein L1887_28354 [Cichorium endivia]|nr:hypothetical protein L1887_28354 [Cichorium endivia]
MRFQKAPKPSDFLASLIIALQNSNVKRELYHAKVGPDGSKRRGKRQSNTGQKMLRLVEMGLSVICGSSFKKLHLWMRLVRTSMKDNR